MSSEKKDDFTQVAEQIPFDNDTNGFIAEDVQEAIEELAFKCEKLYLAQSCEVVCGKLIPKKIEDLVTDDLCFIYKKDC